MEQKEEKRFILVEQKTLSIPKIEIFGLNLNFFKWIWNVHCDQLETQLTLDRYLNLK